MNMTPATGTASRLDLACDAAPNAPAIAEASRPAGGAHVDDPPQPAAASLDAALRHALANLARSPRVLVACDYDGTLAPITADPRSVRPLPEAVTALRALASLPETSTAVISGRALRDLATMSRLPAEIQLIGSHGSEFDIGFVHALDEQARKLHTRLVSTLERLADS